MPYFTLNIGEKIEMNGFQTEAEARAYCRKAYYPILIIFEGTFRDADNDNYGPPVAIYVRGQGCDPVRVEKDVPYKTYRVIKQRLPSAPGFEAMIFNVEDRISYMTLHEQIDEVFKRGVKLLWVIHSDLRFIDVHTSTDRKSWRMLQENHTLDGGDVIAGFSLPVVDLFEEVEVE